MSVKSKIFNPSKISPQEQAFLQDSYSVEKVDSKLEKKLKFKGRMISMSDSFFAELNEYLRINPREGNRSAFIVRVVSEYIEERTKNVGAYRDITTSKFFRDAESDK